MVNKPGGVYVDGIVLKATVPTEKLTLPVHELAGTDPSAARTSARSAYWPELGERVETDVFAFDALRPGNTATLPTSTWLTVSPRGGTRFGHERSIAPVFDFLSAPVAGGYFLGDYQGLTAVDGQFRALFVTANSGQPNNRTDVFYQEAPAFARPSDATDTAPSAALAAPATAGAQVLKPALSPQLRRR